MKFALVNGKEPTEYFKNTYSFYLLKTYLFAGLKRGILILILLYLNVTTVCEISTTVYFKVEIKNSNLNYYKTFI